jgi:hypothetical protein
MRPIRPATLAQQNLVAVHNHDRDAGGRVAAFDEAAPRAGATCLVATDLDVEFCRAVGAIHKVAGGTIRHR